MNPKRFAAACDYRSDTQNTFVDRWRRSSEIGRNQTKIEDAAPVFPLLWKSFEEEMVRMGFEKFPNLAIELMDSFIELTQLSRPGIWPLKPAVRSQRNHP